jgi:hypothetical protein
MTRTCLITSQIIKNWIPAFAGMTFLSRSSFNTVQHYSCACGKGFLLPPGEGQDEGKKVVFLFGFPHPNPLPPGEGIPGPTPKFVLNAIGSSFRARPQAATRNPEKRVPDVC